MEQVRFEARDGKHSGDQTSLAVQAQAHGLARVTSVPVSQQSITSVPSDEQPHLASQMEDMASQVRDPMELSQRLQDFAKDVKILEERVSSYQAEIQRQQVKIQKLEESGGSRLVEQMKEEARSLKEENEHLLASLAANRPLIQMPQNVTEVEPGWVTVNNGLDAHTPSMMQYPNSPLMQRIDNLQSINAKLFKANKDWHSKWESLRQNKQEEKDELEFKLKQSEDTKGKLEAELASIGRQLKDEVTVKDKCQMNLRQQAKMIKDLESKISRLQAEIQTLRANQGPSRESQKERDTEMEVLKQQMSIFMQDFEKERKDKQQFQEKLQKSLRDQEELRARLEKKIRSLEEDIVKKDNRIRTKTREVEHLHYNMEKILDEANEEKKKAQKALEARQNFIHQVPSQATGVATGMTSIVYPSSAAAAPISDLSSFAVGPRRAPEESPGAWRCKDCTYINYADRTVCDICGLKKSLDMEYSMPAFGELQSRGSSPSPIQGHSNYGRNVPDTSDDVEVDMA